MASNIDNRSIQQALLRYDMRNNDYEEPNIFRYGKQPIIRTDRGDMAMNNRALERKVGGSCGCEMRGGAITGSVLRQMDERPQFITNQNFTNPQRPTPPLYINPGQRNFVPYYNMLEMAELNSKANANAVLTGRGIDFGKYANQAKEIGAKYVKEKVKSEVLDLMKNPEVKQLAKDAMKDPEVIKAVSGILSNVKKGGGIWSALGKAGTTALNVGSKVGSVGLKYGATAVEVGAKYGAKGVAVASAVANNPAVQKVAEGVINNPQVQEAVVGIIADQVAKLAPKKDTPEEQPTEPPAEGGRIRRKKGKKLNKLDYVKQLKASHMKGGMMKKLKDKITGKKPDLTQITLQHYRDDDDVFGINSEEENEEYEEAKKKVKHKKPDVEMKDLRSGSGMKGGKNKRALIVKKVMKEQGLGLIQASKYVKQHNLY